MPDSPDADRLRHEALKEELEAARRKRDSYQALLKELPEVFEGKFRERVRPVQQRNDQLLEEGMALREQIRRALPEGGSSGKASLPPAAEAGSRIDEGGTGFGDGRPEVQVAARSVAPRATPRRGALWLRNAGVGGTLIAGLALGLGSLLLASPPWGSKPRSQLAETKVSPAPQNGTPPLGVPSVRLRTSGPSWLEVRSSEGVLLFSGDLEGERSFPLRDGLRIRSGRADLVQMQVTGQPERTLGPIDFLDWTTINPAATAGAKPSAQP